MGGYGGYATGGMSQGLNQMTSNVLGLYQFKKQLEQQKAMESERQSQMKEAMDYRNKMLALQSKRLDAMVGRQATAKPPLPKPGIYDPATNQTLDPKAIKPGQVVDIVDANGRSRIMPLVPAPKEAGGIFGNIAKSWTPDIKSDMEKLSAAGFVPHITSFSAQIVGPLYSGAIRDLMKSQKLTQDQAVQKFLSNQRSVQALMSGAKGLGNVIPKIQASMAGVENTITLLQDSMNGIRKSLTGSPLLNKPLISLADKLKGDPNYRAYIARRETMKQELTKALLSNGISGTAASDAARKEVDTIFPLDETPAQFDTSVKVSRQDMAARLAGYAQTYMGYTGTPLPGAPQNPAAQSSSPPKTVQAQNTKNKAPVRLKYNPATGALE